MSTIYALSKDTNQLKSIYDKLKSDLKSKSKILGRVWHHILNVNTYLSIIPPDILNIIKTYYPGYIFTDKYTLTGRYYVCPWCTREFGWNHSGKIICVNCENPLCRGESVNPYLYELRPTYASQAEIKKVREWYLRYADY